MKSKISIGILTPKQLTTRKEASIVLDLLCDIYPVLMPEKYGNTEPLRIVFDCSSKDEFLDACGDLVFWKRKRPRVEGTIASAHPRQKVHGWIPISVEASKSDIGSLLEFLQETSLKLDVDFAFLHLLTEPEYVDGGKTRTVFCLDPGRQIYNLSVTTYDLRKSIPELYWATVFGPAYVKHFGKECILASPAPIVRELGDESVYIQLSESPFDLIDNYADVDATRQKVKAHLNNNSFFDPNLPEDHIYNVPEFRLELPE